MLGMLAAVGEIERDLLIKRPQSGSAGAKAAGSVLKRLSKTTMEQRAVITTDYAASVSES